jgi:Icc-related predicted phosphoesterase
LIKKKRKDNLLINIIAVSDVEKNLINKEKKKFDILIGCGDLSPGYMDYIANEFKTKLAILIHGNHDKKFYFGDYREKNKKFSDTYKGCLVINYGSLNIKKYIKKNITIAGFSGAMSYGEMPFHFHEKDLKKLKKHYKKKSIDIMISHSPPKVKGVTYDSDRFHQPSEKLGEIYNEKFPLIWLYGHIHRNYSTKKLDYKIINEKQKISYMINASPYKFIGFDEINKKITYVETIKKVDFVPVNI